MRIAAYLCVLSVAVSIARGIDPVFTKSGDGPGASVDGPTIHLLSGGEKEANAFALPTTVAAPPSWIEVRAGVKLDPGGEGLGLLLTNADVAGKDAPIAPLDQPEEPNRVDAIGIGFDSNDPASTDAFDADGNLYDRPQREVSVHVNGREILNRQSADFATGGTVAVYVRLDFVVGGAKLTLRVGNDAVYDADFLPGVRPFVPRLSVGARAGGKVKLDVSNFDLKLGPTVAATFLPPKHVVLFDKTIISLATSREPGAVVDFKDVPKEIGRVIATIKLAAPPAGMDKWDRRGALYLYTAEQRYEIVRFDTPFLREWEWQTDVTDFLPLFKDQQKVGLFIDTWRDGFAMSASLDFYPGVPERKPIGIVNLWQGEPTLGDAKMPLEKFFDRKTIAIPAGAGGAKVRLVVSGHGQLPNSKNAGEFLGLNRTLTVNGRPFQNLLWKTDNYLNPCRPQKGTWKYDRAGWGPGSVTPPWVIDLDSIVAKHKSLALDYAITDPYTNDHIGKGDPPTHWVDGQVIFYEKPKTN